MLADAGPVLVVGDVGGASMSCPAGRIRALAVDDPVVAAAAGRAVPAGGDRPVRGCAAGSWRM